MSPIRHINEPLLWYDYEAQKLVPVLAESWQVLDDTTIQFKLKKGIKFTNGEEFNAEVVKYNFERIAKPEHKSPVYSSEYKTVDRVEVVDASTVKFKLKQPNAKLLRDLSFIFMVPPQHAEKVGIQGFTKEPVGTGPYVLKEQIKDERVVIEKNPNYWGTKPAIDRIVFRAAAEASTRTAALKAGEVDLITLVNIADIPSLKTDKSDVLTVPGNRLMYVILDSTKPGPIQNKLVRQALNYAVDKDAIIKSLFQGYAVKLEGQHSSPYHWGFNPALKAYPYDPDKAKKLLAEAGYPNGFKVPFYAPRGRYVLDKETAEAVAGQVAKVGVTFDLQVRDWGTYIGDFVKKAMTPAMFIGMTGYDTHAQLAIHIPGNPYSYYPRKELSDLLSEAARTFDDNKRLALYKQATEMMYEDPTGIWLHQQVDIYGVSKRLKGWKPRPDEFLLFMNADVD